MSIIIMRCTHCGMPRVSEEHVASCIAETCRISSAIAVRVGALPFFAEEEYGVLHLDKEVVTFVKAYRSAGQFYREGMWVCPTCYAHETSFQLPQNCPCCSSKHVIGATEYMSILQRVYKKLGKK